MDKRILPVLTLRGLVVFPRNLVTFDVGREKSIKSIERALEYDTDIFLVTQLNSDIEDPTIEDLYEVGTVCKIKQIMRFSEDRIRVLVEGRYRAQLCDITQYSPYIEGVANDLSDYKDLTENSTDEALVRNLINGFEEYLRLNPKTLIDAQAVVSKFGNDTETLTYEIANSMSINYTLKQELLEINDTTERAEKLLGNILREIEILNIEREINLKVQQQIGKLQRNAYLREQLKVIKAELGEKDSLDDDVEAYKKRAEESNLPEDVYKKVMKEINRLSKMMPSSAEVPVLTNYINLVLDLPWNVRTEEKINLEDAERILKEDHYGLEKVKERILEYLAVKKLNNTLKGPILCLVGPPGVGKTSIARSVAKSLNRNYVRLSLGGVKDESEIRGHRKTYVGAMPGRIINAIKQAGSRNPLILLDEIDKMGSDFRGDPAAAMLEVLDAEQNNTFRDHYLELPFDLSEVMFITTANTLDTIAKPLLDRMEVIEVTSYTEEEKLQIAFRHLLPKQLKAHGLDVEKIKVEEDAMRDIITCYTAEAGVRNLERELAKLSRKIARKLAERKRKTFNVNGSNLEKLLGIKKRLPEKIREKDEVGVATGLAWTSIGGVTLEIEVNIMPGTGKIELTGSLGSVMKESALAAISFIRSRVDELGIDKDFYSTKDIHIHVPEGATPKDGPSAGITLATAMVSALTGCPCKKSVAMTGEITLRGRILPIGGVKEKILAAHRAGIKTVIIPEDNKKDLEEIPANVRRGMRFVTVASMDTVLLTALKNFNFSKSGMLLAAQNNSSDLAVTDIM